MMGRDDKTDLMAYGVKAWIAGLILAAVIAGFLFGLAQPI